LDANALPAPPKAPPASSSLARLRKPLPQNLRRWSPGERARGVKWARDAVAAVATKRLGRARVATARGPDRGHAQAAAREGPSEGKHGPKQAPRETLRAGVLAAQEGAPIVLRDSTWAL
jgi:hypothetical protein